MLDNGHSVTGTDAMEDTQTMRPKAQHDAPAPPVAERGNADVAEREAHAHAQALKKQAHRPRHLKLIGLVVLVVAVAAVAYGVISRQGHEATLTTETNTAAVPVVALVSPVHGTGPRDLVLPGDVQAFYDAPLYARVNGYVKAWYHDIGARVTKGEVLATIETPELDEQLDQAKGDLAMAQANLALAQVTAKRWHALLTTNSVSQQSADEKASNEQAQEAVVIAQKAHVQRLVALEAFKNLVAPFDGVVTARNIDVGALINQGSSNTPPLFKVADVHAMRVYVRVPQVYASQLKVGMKAVLSQPQYPGVTFPAKLDTTSNSVAMESRTVLAELMAPNPDGKLWPGTYAQVDFQLGSDPDVLRLPTGSLVFREHGAQIAVLGPDNTVAMKDVRVGRNFGTQIEILSGLSPNDKVINAPPDTLENGEKVQVAGNSVNASDQVAQH
jgi:RND family efflux transporter MFP subunit